MKRLVLVKGMREDKWEDVLDDALHAVRSLLCTETNETPQSRMFSFERRSTCGISLPNWLLSPRQVLLKRHVRNSKNEPLRDEVTLLEANPTYAFIRHENGGEATVSLADSSPLPGQTAWNRF